jgi:hypothetical protein
MTAPTLRTDRLLRPWHESASPRWNACGTTCRSRPQSRRCGGSAPITGARATPPRPPSPPCTTASGCRPAGFPGAWRRQLVQGGIGAHPDGHARGQLPQRPAGVGGVGDQVHAAVGVALGDQGDQRRPAAVWCDRGAWAEQACGNHLQQGQAHLIGRSAGVREEPVRSAVVPASGQARAGQHAGDRARPGLGEEPGGQCAQGLEGRAVKQGRKQSSSSASDGGRVGIGHRRSAVRIGAGPPMLPLPPQGSKPLGFIADPTSELMVRTQRHRCEVGGGISG